MTTDADRLRGSRLSDSELDDLVRYDLGRVHASVYTDPGVFEAEMQRIFYRTWNYLGHESEVAAPGDYKTTYIGQVPVILTRTDDQQLRVLVNRCIHRGTTVCQWERGNATYFRCEYHGWTYRNDGSLIGVTLRNGYSASEFKGIAASLDRVPRVASYRGLVFGCLDPGVVSLDEHLGATKEYFDDWFDTSPTGELVVTGGVWKHEFDANWKVGLEGSDERYHVDHLHKIVRVLIERERGVPFRFMPPDLDDLATKDAGHGHGISEINSDRFPLPWRDLFSSEYVDALVERVGQERTAQVLGRSFRLHLFPNAAFGPENIRVFRPIAPDRTEVRQYHVALPKVAGVTERVNQQRVKQHQSWYGPVGTIGEDDFEMFSRIQEGLRAASCSELNPWVWFSRGASTTGTGPNGELVGRDQSEISQRSIYGGWLELMKQQTNRLALSEEDEASVHIGGVPQ